VAQLVLIVRQIIETFVDDLLRPRILDPGIRAADWAQRDDAKREDRDFKVTEGIREL
jgi:hypothetical protein